MAMSYTTLISPKGTSGSIANWTNYGKLDLPTILDEAQIILYGLLRVREMKTEWTFGVAEGQSEVALPERFLDPNGQIGVIDSNLDIIGRSEQDVSVARTYDASVNAALGANPATTAAGSARVTVAMTAHGLTQGSTVRLSGLANVGGLSLTGSFPVVEIASGNAFVIEASSEAASTATGGGSGGSYTANRLIAATPSIFAVWDEAIKFDTAFERAATCKLAYYRRPLLLSADNETNFLTDRYPALLRTACLAGAADFMKDGDEYTKAMQRLQVLVERAGAENDMIYRGAQFGTETP